MSSGSVTPRAPAILVVEDEPTLGRSLARFLSGPSLAVHLAHGVAEAEALHTRHHADIEAVLADVDLPDGNGLDLIARLREADPSLGAVVATGADDARTTDRAVQLGVQGYLHKPFEMSEVRINVENARRWRALDRENAAHRAGLERLVEARTNELALSRAETIQRLAIAAEHRDEETRNHLERISAYSALLSRRAGLDLATCEEIRLASPMHDIGKIAIPDHVLNHDGPFDDAQRAIMNEHTIIGYQILADSTSPLLRTAAEIACSHHEWWDGSGYPYGLRGESIPLSGRIVAIADVFDALTSRRRYKPPFTIEASLRLMIAERGTHFDPRLLDLFIERLDDVLLVHEAYQDCPLLYPVSA